MSRGAWTARAGIGLRACHVSEVVAARPPAGWLEVHAENYMGGGAARRVLESLREDYPIAVHGVGLSLGRADDLDERHLARLQRLVERLSPVIVSEHLSYSQTAAGYLNHLLPLPYTEEALAHVVRRVVAVQERLGRQILLENVSSYLAFTHSTLREWEFLAAVAERADCGLLLDVNNVHVSAVNHGFDPLDYLAGLPAGRVGQIHLAGHIDLGTHLLDTHDGPVIDAVWNLYRHAVCRFGRVSTLMEWDDHIPEFDVVRAEAERARAVEAEVQGAADAAAA
jgi:uncharacterized protein (UPF0276 family)